MFGSATTTKPHSNYFGLATQILIPIAKLKKLKKNVHLEEREIDKDVERERREVLRVAIGHYKRMKEGESKS